MSIFKSRKQKKAAQKKQNKAGNASAKATQGAKETSPQKVGVVSSVLPSGSDKKEKTPFSDVVAKRFLPTNEPAVNSSSPDSDRSETMMEELFEPTFDMMEDNPNAEKPEFSRQRTRSVEEPAFMTEEPEFLTEEPELETDPMANIGRATTITGDIVAEEDLEIHGTIEGSVRLVEHKVTVGNDGLVKASVAANIVLVHGKITGDVTATDLIEVKPGGIVGGDVKAPRVIMHDGAVIVGGLDMSAALPGSANASASEKKVEKEVSKKKGERPVLKPVGLPPVHEQQKAAADSKGN